MTRRAAICTFLAGAAGAFFANVEGPKQKPYAARANEIKTNRKIRVWINGSEVTNDCFEFETDGEKGWANCFDGPVGKRKIVTFADGHRKVGKTRYHGRIFYTIDGDPCYVST